MPKVVKISFKDELRRVPIGVEGRSETYDDLLIAIKVTFPSTQGATLRLTWKDEDGDIITMSSSNEFDEAMKGMAKGVPKFALTAIPTTSTSSPTPAPTPSPTPIPTPPNTTVHDNVECDGCGMVPIIGVRYTSKFRNNYDLCEKCEATLKPTETMIKLTQKAPTPSAGPAALLSDTLGQVVSTIDSIMGSNEAKQVWQRC